jgi:hypothetical protein
MPADAVAVGVRGLTAAFLADKPPFGYGRVQIFGSELTLAKYCQQEWPTERGKQAIDEMVRNRGLN